MFYENISYLVGSANAKLASDIKRIQKETRCKSSRFPSYLFCSSNLRQESSNDSNDFNIDFEIVKISCKKEAHDLKNKKCIVKNVFFENPKLELAVKIFIFILIGSIVSFSIYRIVNLRNNSKLVNQNGVEIDNTFNKSIPVFKRSANIFSMNDTIEWSGEKIPMCYQIEPLTFFDSDSDGFGDLNGITIKLDYFKNALAVNCLLIRNLQSFYDLDKNRFIMNQSSSIDFKIGKLDDLHHLIDSAHKLQIRVIKLMKIF